SCRPDGATTTVSNAPGAGLDVIGMRSSTATLTSTRVGTPPPGWLIPTRVPLALNPRGWSVGSSGRGGVGAFPMPASQVPPTAVDERRNASWAPSGEITGLLDRPLTPGIA